MAAAVFPLMALIGGGIDMGRGYLAQARLQQACDSGVLAAHKRLGNTLAVSGTISTDVADTGNRFFNLNFRDGAYGTENRQFVMSLDVHYSIFGEASVDLPTTLMKIFGYDSVPVKADCAAQLNITNTDIVMVLDTTGSMAKTNPGDSVSKIEALKTTVTTFYAQMMAGAAACPARARKLATLDLTQLNAFLGTLVPEGNTYHDIGMLWGGRLISPSGLFAAENADLGPSAPTSRHLIFLTDGETAPRDIAYSSYGVEPLDQRRWKPGSPMSLTQTVENRFAFACEEVKKRNISVWVISFGTAPNPVMEACAGTDKYYVADDATELDETFESIAKRIGELRVTR